MEVINAKNDIGPIEGVYIQSTSLCNLNCDYCYLPESERKQSGIFPLESVRPVFSSLFASSFARADQQIAIRWHIGEPLLLPINYYQSFIDIIHDVLMEIPDKQLTIKFGFQTNGITINDEWCRFFKENDIEIGLSCDGPEFLHDVHRKRWNQSGTFQQVLQAITKLQSNNIPFGILSTVTPDTLQHAEAFFNFFVAHNLFKIGLNFVRKVGAHKFDTLSEHLEECQKFIRRLFELYLDYRSKHPERYVLSENLMRFRVFCLSRVKLFLRLQISP